MQITINISESDKKALENDLVSIEQWVQDAVKGKVEKCKGRMVSEWLPKLMQDPLVETVPANEVALIDLITARTDYKNRVTREQDSLAKR